MWLRFTQDFDFSPSAYGGRVTIAYKTGMLRNVTRECAEQAISAGKAKRTIAPRQEAGNGKETRRG